MDQLKKSSDSDDLAGRVEHLQSAVIELQAIMIRLLAEPRRPDADARKTPGAAGHDAISWAMTCDVSGSPTTRLVLVALARFARPDGTAAYPTIAELQQATNLSDRAVQKHLRQLEQLGLIRRRESRQVQSPDQGAVRTRFGYDLCLVPDAPPLREDGPAPIWEGGLISVFTATIGGVEQLACDARTLHGFLGVKRVFSSWILGRIEKYGFVKEEDYLVFDPPDRVDQKRGGDRRSIDYHLTLDMAKELAMVENNPKGREVRKYFIACERRLHDRQPATPARALQSRDSAPAPKPAAGDDFDDPELLAFIALTRGRMGGDRNTPDQVSLHTARLLRWLWHRCLDEQVWYDAARKPIGSELGMCHTTVLRCLRRLENWGFIEQRQGRGRSECRLIRPVVELALAGHGDFAPRALTPPNGFNDDMAIAAGSPGATVFLIQALEWQRQHDDRWWSKTVEAWAAATGLNLADQQAARQRLKKSGILKERYRGAERWYWIDKSQLKEVLKRRKSVVIEISHQSEWP